MYDLLIIDGNNLLHFDPALDRIKRQDFAQARQELVDKLDDAANRLAREVILVFDGTIGGKGREFRHSVIDIYFSPADLSADSVIERMVAEHVKHRTIMVVTSDRAERHTVEGSGAEAMSCRMFLEELAYTSETRQRDMGNAMPRKRPPNLGDLFPDL